MRLAPATAGYLAALAVLVALAAAEALAVGEPADGAQRTLFLIAATVLGTAAFYGVQAMTRSLLLRDGDWRGLGDRSQWPRYRAVAKLLRVRDRVLDVGCGAGELLHWLPGDQRYLGVDVSAEAIRHARLAHPAERFTRMDVEAYPVQDESGYDAVVLNEVLQYVRDPAALVLRFARPGVRVVCSVRRCGAASWRRRLLVRCGLLRYATDAECERLVRDAVRRAGLQVSEDSTVESAGWPAHGVWCVDATDLADADAPGERSGLATTRLEVRR